MGQNLGMVSTFFLSEIRSYEFSYRRLLWIFKNINVLSYLFYLPQVDNVEDMLRDKENQLQQAKSRLATIQADHSASDSALTSLETSLAEREKQIER